MITHYRRGALLVASSSVAWSSAGLIARWVDTPAWTTLFWRSAFAALFILGQIAVQEPAGIVRTIRRLRRPGIAMAAAFALSMTAFINALSVTRVANVLVFHAATPFVAAILAWIWIKERPQPLTLAAVCVSLFGVVIMVSGSTAPANLLGSALSGIMVVTFAMAIVLGRANPGQPMGAVTLLAMVFTALMALPFAGFDLSVGDFALLALFGIGQMGLGSRLFTAGVKFLPAADVGLISVLETVLGPLWVWLAVGEAPDQWALGGGGLVLGAVLFTALSERGPAKLAASTE
jgi:drug/metabolite transporter (DMT)-like permease